MEGKCLNSDAIQQCVAASTKDFHTLHQNKNIHRIAVHARVCNMKSIAYLLMVVVATMVMVMVSCPALELDCRVTFDNQQGSAPNPKSMLVMYGQLYGARVETTQESYLFDGWWTRANGTGGKVEETTVASIPSSHAYCAKGVLTVAEIGPAGGYEFYDKGSGSNGSRYLLFSLENLTICICIIKDSC